MLRSLKELCPVTQVIILTMDEHSDYLLEVHKAGAVRYLFKDVTRRELIATIQYALSSVEGQNEEPATHLRHKPTSHLSPPAAARPSFNAP